jgi:hypothetical protein
MGNGGMLNTYLRIRSKEGIRERGAQEFLNLEKGVGWGQERLALQMIWVTRKFQEKNRERIVKILTYLGVFRNHNLNTEF